MMYQVIHNLAVLHMRIHGSTAKGMTPGGYGWGSGHGH